MRKAAVLVAAAIVWLAVPLTAAAAGITVDVSELVARPGAWNGVEVEVRGEMVGDFGRRDGEVWVQLNGDPYVDAPLISGGDLAGGNVGIGARIPTDVFAAGGFVHPGGYRHRGPVVRATGIWRYHDAGRGGESYLDVTGLEVDLREQPLDEGPRPWALGVGAVLLTAAGVLEIGNRRRRRLP